MPIASEPVFSAAVMAHPSRFEQARHIVDRLAGTTVELAVDPDPDGPPSTVRTARRAFAAATAEATHHLVVQDDVSLADGFLDALGATVALHPEAALSLFVEWGSRTAYLARWAAFTGTGFVPVINPYMPMQALVLPRQLALDVADYLRTDASDDEPDDRAVLRFLAETNTRRLAVVPNLVEHLDFPSLTGNGDHGARRAVCAALAGDFPVRRPDVLAVPRFLPFFVWTSGKAVVIETANDVPGAHLPAGEALRSWGFSPVRQAAEYRSSLSLLNKELLQVDRSFLEGVWRTAVALGAVTEAAWPGAVKALDDAGEFATEALFTLAPGALRRFVDVSVFEEHRADVTAWLRAAVSLGADRCELPEPMFADRPG